MRKTAVAAAIVAALTLASCATYGDKGAVSSLRFNYVTEGGKAIGLVRAFDDGQRTTLQFVTDAPDGLKIFDAVGQLLAYQRIGQNVVLPSLYSPVRVEVGAATATVKSTVPVVTKELIQQRPTDLSTAAVTPADAGDELQATRAALKLAEKQIAELRAELERMKARNAGRKDRVPRMAEDPTTTVFRIEFGFARSDFVPGDEMARVLLPAAKAAHRVNLRGFTDSMVLSEENKRLALARALSARQYLTAQGVDPNKVRVFYNSAGGFVADNTTPEGQAKNRRVDIELVNSN